MALERNPVERYAHMACNTRSILVPIIGSHKGSFDKHKLSPKDRMTRLVHNCCLKLQDVVDLDMRLHAKQYKIDPLAKQKGEGKGCVVVVVVVAKEPKGFVQTVS